MRVKLTKIIAFVVVFINIIVIYYSLRLFISFGGLQLYNDNHNRSTIVINKSIQQQKHSSNINKHLSKLITIVIRLDVELNNDNLLTTTIQSFLNIFPNIQIIIVYDSLPYPPVVDNINLLLVAATRTSSWTTTTNTTSITYNALIANNKNIKFINLSPKFDVPFTERYPLFSIRTKYVLFVPDSIRIENRQVLQLMLAEIVKAPSNKIIVASTPQLTRNNKAIKKKASQLLNCLKVNISTREWTLKFSSADSHNNNYCDLVSGDRKQLILIETNVLRKLPDAFLLPFPHALYLQTAALNLKVKILIMKSGHHHHHQTTSSFHDDNIKSSSSKYRRSNQNQVELKHLYKIFGIKKVVRESGSVEWYGCTRDTPRCFSPIIDSYQLLESSKQWTPPCCLAHLRQTARHVFASLDEAGVRYWLDAGSLLGAMRAGDVLPWDNDADVSFNVADLNRSGWLVRARDRPVVDAKGFLWERIEGGNFYRVYYSKTNRIYVNLFPFACRDDGMMVWLTTKSDKNWDFPDVFLHPMSSIEFAGRLNVPCPNNVRDFLEIRYGKGVIENVEYPDPSRLSFP